MKAVDTNIVLRFVLDDDGAQSPIAESLVRAGVFVPVTVLLEAGWVLSSRYGFDRQRLAATLAAFLDVPSVQVADEPGMRAAIERHRAGADLADAFHLTAAGGSEAFVTFDKHLARLEDPPIPIELAS